MESYDYKGYDYFSPKEMDELVSQLHMPPSSTYITFDDDELNTYASYCRALDEYEDKVLKLKKTDLTTLLINKYYWRGRMEICYFKLYGHNSGLAQQTSKTLEEIDQRLPDINWKLVELVSKALEKERDTKNMQDAR